jgi:hypothetical protein
MTLYNLKTDGDHYRITKFDSDLNVESSYLLSATECECPAGHRPSCRHRQMLPKMLAGGALNKPSFYDFDSDTFFDTEVEVDDRDLKRAAQGDPQFADPPDDLPVGVEVGAEVGVSVVDTPAIGLPVGVKAVGVKAAEEAPHPTIGHVKRRI